MNKLPLFTMILALGGVGCAPNTSELHIRSLNLNPDDNCGAPTVDQHVVYGGYLDIAVGAEFWLGMVLEATIPSGGSAGDLTLSNGTVLESASRDSPTVDRLVMNYTTTPKLGPKFNAYSFPVLVPFADQSTLVQRFLGGFNIISTDAAEKIKDNADQVSDSSPVTLTVAIEAQGFMARQGNRITSGPVPFAITMSRSAINGAVGAACPKGANAYRRGTIANQCIFPGQVRGATSQPAYCCNCGDYGSAACFTATEPGCY